ncbi:MAG TPA: UvrD-helicase domain-containing protein [Methylomirabilota bacterium]|nr:UvrD-helicase domain-containing protein [Methylomirabilota bacterium]
MTLLPKSMELPDELDRRRAIETFDRNLVVTAGAGTGKTTLLVDRLAHLLLRNPNPLRITEIVALTFTNKAANEMKQRLRNQLQGYLEVDLQAEPLDEAQIKRQREVEALIQLYQLSKDELDTRVHEALRNLERADIGTIHSFAASLLRLYPLEAGVDPQFHEDDGNQFQRTFDEEWDLWLDQELSLKSSHADDWRRVFKQLSLDQIKELASSLCSETVELKRGEPNRQKQPAPILRSWLQGLLASAAGLVERHPEDRVNEELIRVAQNIVQEYLHTGGLAGTALADQKAYLAAHSINRNTKGWSESDVEKAQELLRAARGLCKIDAGLTELIWQLLVPYVERFRDIFVREGSLSFDGLLIRARNLVRDNLRVREELKRQYLTILIDEFQDTDPIQYEILLYLAEQSGHAAKDWRKVKLTPGKVFVVGDPKQSIYAFRRADIEAYLEVVEKIVKAQNGVECRLTTNFRSAAPIVDVVNGVFSSLIQAQPGVQPPYVGIHPAPQRNSLAAPGSDAKSLPKVLVRKIVAPAGEMNAEKARRLEGESLAAWLQNELLDKVAFVNAKGEHARVQPKDIAILFRKLTDIYDYLEPLRRRSIRYVVEGERHFYAAKEIIDAVNLLRAVDNPHDRLALVGVLRSPLGGVTDQNIYDLHCQNLLDYRKSQWVTDKDFPPTLAELYRTLAKLRDDCRTLPVGDAVSHIFATLPLKLLAACYFHGEQAVANLEKLRQQAEILGREDASMTFKEAIRQLQARVLDVKEEGESVLAEENVDAVRIMSIHKSKGLEFPIVVLAGCHTGTDARPGRTAEALFDWSSGLTGIRVGPFTDLAGLYVSEKNRLRAKEEQKRVLYVGMTRARERLIISSGPETKRSTSSFVDILDEALEDQISGAGQSTVVAIETGKLEIEIVEASLTAPGPAKSKKQTPEKKSNWQPYVDAWARRRSAYEAAIKTPLFVTPTLLKQQEQEVSEAAYQTPRLSYRTPSMLLGELTHRVLEGWDFAKSRGNFGDRMGTFLDQWLPPEFRRERARIQADLAEIFGCFFGSKIYSELAKSQILGREVPLLMPWNGQIMEGVIDLIYEHDGLLYLADYKTDRIAQEELTRGAERYRRQAQVYSRAAQESLQREVAAFNVIFLRLGEAIRVSPEAKEKISSPVQLQLI